MDKRHLKSVLEETFAANFVTYYRAHVAHVNTTGRSFYQDHKLLQKIYEYFQDNIDTLAEKLRTVRATMPVDLGTVLEISPVMDSPTTGDSEDLLRSVLDDISMMVDQYHALYQAAEEVDYIDISNFAQDQIGIIVKFRWMLEATLEDEPDEPDEDDELDENE
jgi:DNA-binding ferritin-like protein